MARRRRSQGIGLGGLLVIIGLLYFTGAGSWLWARVKTFDENCYAVLIDIGTDWGSPLCAGFGKVIQAIDSSATNVGSSVSEWVTNLKSRFGGMVGFTDFRGFTQRLTDSLMRGDSPLNSWISPSDKLASMMSGRPYGVGSGAGAGERIRSALDNFVIGQHFLNSGSTENALPWLRQSAQQPGYGILSQLALGDLYRGGASNIPADPVQSRFYYQQASQSLSVLNNAGTPEAAQMLQALPASPAQIQQQIISAIGSMNKQIKR